MRPGMLVFALLLAVVPAHAGAFPCSAKADYVASAQINTEPAIGSVVSCVPGLTCDGLSGCVFTVKVAIHGDGVVGGMVQGPFGTVTCGPAPVTCTVASEDFHVPYDGLQVTCSSGNALAVHVELVCLPTQLR